MKKLFQQIDDLCVNASMHGVCTALRLHWYSVEPFDVVHIQLNGKKFPLPGATDPLWRRKWRKFLTDHVDDVANNLDEAAAAAHASQSGSAV